MNNFHELSWEDGPKPIDPNSIINTFPYLKRDTLNVGNHQEFILYFKYPVTKAFCKVASINNQGESSEFSLVEGTTRGFKAGQVITLIDEVGKAFFLLTVNEAYSDKITTIEKIPFKGNQSFVADVYVQTRTLYTKNPGTLNSGDRGIFRYLYLPTNWNSVSPFGLIAQAERSDIKTFSSNVSLNWDIVIQDTVIEEEFPQMDYEFLSEFYALYAKQNLIGYRPRDLNLNLYLVEMLPIEISKLNRYWAEGIKIKYKIHSVLNDFGYISELSKIK